MRDEIQLYYFLLDIIKSSTTLQRLTWKAPAAAFVAIGAARRRQSTQVLRQQSLTDDAPSRYAHK